MGVNVIICYFFFLYSINSIQYHNLYKTLNTFGKDTYTVGYYYRNCERLNNILENIEISDNEKCGLISDDLDDYTNKVISLLNDEKKYNEFSKHWIKHVKKFTIKNQTEKLEKLIDEME